MSLKRFIFLFTASAALLALTACGTAAPSASPAPTGSQAPAGVAVQTTTVLADTIAAENRVTGKIVSDDQTNVMVATTAKCTAVYVEAGDTVRAGQAICTLDLASVQANYNAALISYNAAVKSYEDQKAILDAQVAQTEKQIADLKALFEIGAAAQVDVDSAELGLMQLYAQRDSALAQLEAGMQSGKSSLEQLSLILEDVDANGNVIAPVSGTLVSLTAAENGYISASMPVAVIDGAEEMTVTAAVSESLVPKLTIGDEVDVTVSAVNAAFTGTISSVEKTANMQTKLYTVTVSVPAGTEGLLAGMSADLVFKTDYSADTIVIPTEAILTSGGKQYVFVVEGDAARYVEVTTGLTGSGVTEVTSGLSVGQQLVTVGQAYLEDGTAVRVVAGEG